MARLSKGCTLQIRMTSEQISRLERAARAASIARGENVAPSTLAREIIVRRVEEMAAKAEGAAA